MMEKLLENEKIRLRAIEPEDLDVLYSWENDTDLWKWGASITPFSRFSIKQYLIDSGQDIYERKQLRLMIEETASKHLVGTIDLYDFNPFHQRAGVGILIDKAHQQNGYALQALTLLEQYCFNFLKMNQLYAFIAESNEKSIALFKHAGYVQSAKLHQWLSLGTGFTDTLVLQRLKTDYL